MFAVIDTSGVELANSNENLSQIDENRILSLASLYHGS
ncbi:hypothetical protein CKA32_004716 [Geitlerinema sp. FC II]|nr:hypothetical protein CKA32_004716 [Geitlerinema sp. FC II]